MWKSVWRIIGGSITMFGTIVGIFSAFPDAKDNVKFILGITDSTSTMKLPEQGTSTKTPATKPSSSTNSRFIEIKKINDSRVYICANGDRYETNWENESYDGHGTLKFNARRGSEKEYVGQFSNFKPHGYGTMYYSDGTSKNGKWAHGKLIE